MAGGFSGTAPEGRFSVGEEQRVVANATTKLNAILFALTANRSPLLGCALAVCVALSRACHFFGSDSVVAQLSIERSLSDVENFRRFPPIAACFSQRGLDGRSLDLRHRHPGRELQRRRRRGLIRRFDRSDDCAGAECRSWLDLAHPLAVIATFIIETTPQLLHLQPQLQHAPYQKLQLATFCTDGAAHHRTDVHR